MGRPLFVPAEWASGESVYTGPRQVGGRDGMGMPAAAFFPGRDKECFFGTCLSWEYGSLPLRNPGWMFLFLGHYCGSYKHTAHYVFVLRGWRTITRETPSIIGTIGRVWYAPLSCGRAKRFIADPEPLSTFPRDSSSRSDRPIAHPPPHTRNPFRSLAPTGSGAGGSGLARA